MPLLGSAVVDALDLAVANLTSAPVLAFAVGVLAATIRADIRLISPGTAGIPAGTNTS